MRGALCRRGIAALVALWAAAGCGKSEALRHRYVGPPASFAIPFEGPGQLASIWSWGQPRPQSGRWALVVASGGRFDRLPFQIPKGVRWRSPEELIVEHSTPPQRSGSGWQILRVSPGGEVLEVLGDSEGLAFSEPSPDGRWLALSRLDGYGRSTLEIRDLEGGFGLRVAHHAPRTRSASSLGIGKIWSPDGSRLAVTVWGDLFSDEPGILTVRTILVLSDRPGYALLPDRVPGEDRGRRAVWDRFFGPSGASTAITGGTPAGCCAATPGGAAAGWFTRRGPTA